MTVQNIMQEAAKLSEADKAELVELLMSDLAKAELTPAQAADLRRRIEADARDPKAGRRWEDVRKDLKRKHRECFP
jgi:putative addiction module component (TIGR02574 family)